MNFEGDVDPNTFEEFLEPEEYVDHGHLFTTDRIFNSEVELIDWAKETTMKANTYLIINWYLRARTSDHRLYVTLACKRGGAVKKNTKPIVDDEEEEEVPIKRQGPYETKKCGCLFKLKGEQMATNEKWQLFVYDGRHNRKIAVFNQGHTQVARLTEEQLKQTEQFRKSHMSPPNILRFFREQNDGCAVRRAKVTKEFAQPGENSHYFAAVSAMQEKFRQTGRKSLTFLPV
ncbi:hypothetical protein M9H77_30831 [Catharanthus roseus]|uniref:Uncharacterized protein n=1 Tax=Catharanthus roseus TaxID=4058 RepID=A0ACB9ZZ78_CATRO|nr:hypothetical protein M9H77_30831 [Catharanthus roseus]